MQRALIIFIIVMLVAGAGVVAADSIFHLGIFGGEANTPHEHEYTSEVTKEPTCSEAGERTFTCECGEDTYTEVIEKLAHTEVEDAAVAPTCTTAGKTAGKHCSVCGETIVAQESIDELGHTEVEDAAVAPTCTTAGKTAGKHCSVCGETIVAQESIDALGHKYTSVVTAATCTEGGYTTYTCSTCGDSYVADQVDAKGHTEKTLAAVAPTCTETGLTEGKQCTVCNTVTVAQQTVDAKGHTEKTLAAVAPTCTATGLTEGKQCTVCNTVTVAQQTVDANGHSKANAVKENVVDATCSATGSYDSVVYCSVCSEELSRTAVTVDKKAHTEVVDAAVAPDCTDTGLTEGKHCSVCGEVTLAQEVVKALGHTEKVIPGTPATCLSAGLSDGKQCSVCNAILEEQKEIEALGHDERVLPAVAATCTTEGKTEGKFCYECGVTLVAQTVVPKIPHAYDDESDLICNSCGYERACLHPETVVVPGKEATCTENGLTAGTKCSVCGDIVDPQETIEALGHTEVKIPAVAPTCTEKGNTEGKKCYTCGEILVQPTSINAKGHTEKILAAVAPTCTKTGLTEGKQCTTCGTITVEQDVRPVIDHNYSTELTKGETQHWYACTACGAKSDVSDHAYTEEIGRKNATCTADGYIQTQCECGAVKTTVISSKGHSYSTEWTETETEHWHACTACGDKADLAKHNYTKETSRTEATCTDNGSYTMACECGATKTTVIESEGHKYSSVVTKPTCTADGYTTYTCSVCGDNYNSDTVNKLGHSYSSVVTAPTCTDKGYTTYTCSTCGDNYKDNETEKLDHVDANGDFKCDNNCGEIVEPKADSTLTLPEADALGKVMGTDKTTNKYYIEGVITEVKDATWGNIYIQDAEGNTLLIYGLYSADGSTRYDAMTVKPAVGDTVKVYGVMTSYNGNAQMKDGWLIEHTVPECEHVDANGDYKCDNNCGAVIEPVADSTLTIEQALALGAVTNTTNKYYITGTISSISNTQYGNLYIKDASGNTIYIYGLYSADGSTRYDAMETKPAVHDTITVYSTISSYNGTVQLKNANMTAHTVHEHVYVDGSCSCGATEQVITTIPEALKAGADSKVLLTGVVCGFYETWSSYGNCSPYIKDAEGNEILIFRTTTNVGLGDTITVSGVIGSYNDVNQVAQGSTVTINTVHGDNHTYEDGVCTICGAQDPSTTPVEDKATYVFSEYAAGTQYAADEEHILDDNTTVVTTECHFTSQLRIYSSSTHNGVVIIKSVKPVAKLTVSAGNKVDVLVVYGSNDNGATWTQIGEISVTSTSYKDYTCEFADTYNWIKLDVKGENQVRLQNMTLTFGANCEHKFETDPTCDKAQTCTLCGEEVIADHTEVAVDAKNPTCGAVGNTAGTKCSVCGEVLSGVEEIPATGEHTYDDGKDAECNVCGNVRDVSCKHPDTTTIAGYAATCTEKGLTDGTKCANEECGAIIVEQEEIPALGHTVGAWIDEVPATCGKAGTVGHYTCSVCNDNLDANKEKLDSIVIAKLEHTFDNNDVCSCGAKKLTLSFADKTYRIEFSGEIQVWSQNGIILTNDRDGAQTAVADYANPARFYSGSKMTIEFGAPVTKVIFIAPNDGSKLEASLKAANDANMSVSRSSTTITVIFANPVETLVFKNTGGYRVSTMEVWAEKGCEHTGGNPTCEQSAVCDLCGKDYYAPHTEEVVTGTAATCGQAGLTDGKKCSVCGTVTVAQKEIAATGNHAYGDPVVVDATCTVDGSSTKTCGTCGDVKTDVIRAGHLDENDDKICDRCKDAIEGSEDPVSVTYYLQATVNGTTYYWNGAASSGKGVLTKNVGEAAVLTMEETDGGVYIYFTNSSGVKTYLYFTDGNTGFKTTTTFNASSCLLKYDSANGSVYKDFSTYRYASTYGTQDIRSYKMDNIKGTNTLMVMTPVA